MNRVFFSLSHTYVIPLQRRFGGGVVGVCSREDIGDIINVLALLLIGAGEERCVDDDILKQLDVIYEQKQTILLVRFFSKKFKVRIFFQK